jgi:methionyl aminopeptidase
MVDWQQFLRSVVDALNPWRPMIIGKSRKDLDKMRASGRLVAQVREAVRAMVQPGVTTLELEQAAEKMIRDAGALPTFKGYNGFPFAICASLNEQVVHGFPNNKPLVEGDIISIDIGVTLNGWVGDTAKTIPVGNVGEEKLRLIQVTEECLERAIAQCWPGKRLGDIGWAVQSHAEANGYSVVREYVGHGIGRKMHEEPQVANYGKPGTKALLRHGYVFAIEPMVNMGRKDTKLLSDKWTVVTADGLPSSHCEHTVAITEQGPEILTLVK